MKDRKQISIGQIGFGKTGRAVASVLLESERTDLKWILRKTNKLEHRSISEFLGIPSDGQGLIYSTEQLSAEKVLNKMPVDVIVDFSSESGIEYYGDEIKKRGITLITAISEYSKEKIEYIKELAQYTKVIASPNITVGINFLMIAAKILKKIAPYTDIEIIEEHFKQKPEISGTAKRLANSLNLGEDSVKSVRAGGIIGVHEILFGFPYQTVRLKHESISREAFGNGILFAIANIPEAESGLFTMEDLMMPHFNITHN